MGNSPCHSCAGKQKPGEKIKVTQSVLVYKLKPNLRPDIEPQASPQNRQLYKQKHKLVQVDIKERTRFKWIQQNKFTYPESIKDLDPELIRRRSFQQKVQWFRLKLQERKVSWTEGSDNIFVDRTNILISSYEQLQKLNITKEIKVNFTDEKGENDAGGIMRQWMNLCMKQLYQTEFGLLKMCDTQDTYYKFTLDEKIIEQCLGTAKFLGYLIAKALLERIPINCHLNHTIWRQLLQQRIIIDDLYSYDKELYKNWKNVIERQGLVEQLFLDFTVIVKDPLTNKSRTFQLIPNGKKTPVTESNKQEYIRKLIQFYTIKKPSQAIENIKLSLLQIIPINYLSIFQPYEIDSLLCGQQNIDINDWKINTVYEGYEENNKMVEWFWTVVGKLQPKMAKNLLHYCTGCSRVPVTGFKYLQSNRGEIKKFTIRKTTYDQGNPYPKSYTCFNRLQLPEYQTYQELQMRVYTICSQQINQINMDA